jgi:hypothetical protein
MPLMRSGHLVFLLMRERHSVVSDGRALRKPRTTPRSN